MLCYANIKGLHKSAAHRTGTAELELQKLWPRFHKESNDVKISGRTTTSHHSEAKSSAEIWRRRCDHKSEFPHTLSLLAYLCPSLLCFSLPASLGQRRHILNPLVIGLPAVHQQKTINCFIGWSSCKVMSSALPIPGIPLAHCVCESVSLVKYFRKIHRYFQVLLTYDFVPCAFVTPLSRSVSVG